MTATKVTILPVTNPNPLAPKLTSTAWTPNLLGPSLVGWLKANAGVTVDGTGVNVTSIADQSGTGVPALVQATTGNTPNLVAAAQNGLPVLAPTKFVLSSVQPYLQGATPVANWSFQPNQPFTIVVAIQKSALVGPDGAFVNPILSHLNFASPLQGWFVGAKSFAAGYLPVFSLNAGSSFATTNCINVTGSTPLLGGNNYVIMASYDGSGHAAGVTLTVNGVPQTNTVVDDALPSSIIYTAAKPTLWTSSSGFGQNAETFFEGGVVNRQLSVIESTSFVAYLRTVWGF